MLHWNINGQTCLNRSWVVLAPFPIYLILGLGARLILDRNLRIQRGYASGLGIGRTISPTWTVVAPWEMNGLNPRG